MTYQAPFSIDEKQNWLRLIRAEKVGSKRFFSWLKKFGSIERVLYEIEKGSLTNFNITLPSIDIIQKEIRAHEKFGAKLIAYNEADYPFELKQIPDAPPVISVVGNINLLQEQKLAIIGARNASYMGQKWTKQTAQELGQLGYVIVSGLARGIDGAAHKASLQTGTIAVVAGGLEHIYPPEHTELFHKIKQHGLIISENPFYSKPQAKHFPRRNRVISGLCQGLIVVEAAKQSGSLITARYALDHNRELFVIPGSPMDPRYQGSNMLIKNGAHLVQSSQDIIEGLDLEYKLSESKRIDHNINFIYEKLDDNVPNIVNKNNSLTDDGQKVQTATQKDLLDCLSEVPILIDELANHCQMRIDKLQLAVSALELEGKIIRHAGNRVSKKG